MLCDAHVQVTDFILPLEAIILHTYTHHNMMSCKACSGKALVAVTGEHIAYRDHSMVHGLWHSAAEYGMEQRYLKPVSNLKKLHLLYCHTVLLANQSAPRHGRTQQ